MSGTGADSADLPTIGVLANADSWYLGDLQRAASGLARIVPLRFEDMSSRLSSHEHIRAEQLVSHRLEAMIVRTMPSGSLEQVVFRMDVLAALERQGTVIVNPPKAMELAIDKYLSLSRLCASGFPIPETWVGQTWKEAASAYESLGPDVVIKPIFGGEGRGVMRVTDIELAIRACKTLSQLGHVIYMQRYVDHPGHDLRVLAIGRQLWGLRRIAADGWRTNLSRGATAEPTEIPAYPLELTLRAMNELGLEVAGLDFLTDRHGRWHLLEVNAVPGWKGLAAVYQTDIARAVIQHVLNLRDRQVRSEVSQ